MGAAGNTWAIVLAGGEGSRLRSVTTTALGVAIPKQFCSLHGGDSLLHDALKRAESIASPDHICAVVSQQHRRWWESALAGVASVNIIVQPRNCGTANGILLPLLCILERDPEARVVILPSDHHVRKESSAGGSSPARRARIIDAVRPSVAHGNSSRRTRSGSRLYRAGLPATAPYRQSIGSSKSRTRRSPIAWWTTVRCGTPSSWPRKAPQSCSCSFGDSRTS